MENLTDFLTSTLLITDKRILEKAQEIVLYLLESPRNEGYAKKIADHYGRDRREYSHILNKLQKFGIVSFHAVRSSLKVIKLNSNVKNHVKKIVGSALNSHSHQPQPVESGSKVSKSEHRGHRILGIFFHNLSSFRVKEIMNRGKKHKNNTATITEAFSGQWIDFQISEKKICVYHPTIFGHDFVKLKDEIRIQLGKFAYYLEERYHMRLELAEVVPIKYEVAMKDDFHVWLANKLYDEGHRQVVYPDWSMDASLGEPEVELNHHWLQAGEYGEGDVKYQMLLDMPTKFENQYQQVTDGLVEVVKHMQLQNEKSQTLNFLLDDIADYITSKLATRDDIESLRGDVAMMRIDTSDISDELIQLLAHQEKSLLELAFAMSMSKSGVLYRLKQIEHKIVVIHRRTGQKGRPTKYYKLKGEYVDDGK